MALGKFAVDYEQRVDYVRLRAERLQRAKDQINKDGLGALVTWDEANVRYLTGYYITTPNRPLEAQFAFVRPQRRAAHHRRQRPGGPHQADALDGRPHPRSRRHRQDRRLHA